MQDFENAIKLAQNEKGGKYYEPAVAMRIQDMLNDAGEDLGPAGIDSKFGMKTQAAAVARLKKIGTPDALKLAEKVGAIKLANEHDYDNGALVAAFGLKAEPHAALQMPKAARNLPHRRELAAASTQTPKHAGQHYNKVAMSPSIPPAKVSPVLTADNDHRPANAPGVPTSSHG
jgi:hypothetical protein